MIMAFWRSLLIISFGLIGIYLGFWVGGAYFVPKGAGLAGGATVLMYGVLGFVGFAIAGAIIAFRLHAKTLRNTALIVTCPVLLFYLALIIIALIKAAGEPDTAFAPAGKFSITMERVDISDPYLFSKMHVDSKTRTWVQTGPAPKHKICSARIKAKNLIKIRQALDTMLALSSEKLTDCNQTDQPVVKRLHWNLIDAQLPQGSLDVNSTCLHHQLEIARTFSLVETVSHQPGGKITCK